MNSSQQYFRHLSAFWPHLSLYPRKCDFSGADIISVYPPNCPYPVYHKDLWRENVQVVWAEFDDTRWVFEQAWDIFSRTAIPHNFWIWSENCEYTDDAWYSRNSYLTHNMLQCENTYYSHRAIELTDCRYCVYSYTSKRCSDLVYCFDCFQVFYALMSKRCSDSAFLFDCEDCRDCLLCWNLRNKQYCIGNQQFTRETYEIERKKYNLASRKVYAKLKIEFQEHILKNAWWRASHMVSNEVSTGDYLSDSKSCTECFILDKWEDCSYGMRASWSVSSHRFVSVISSNHVTDSVNVWEQSRNIAFSVNISHCQDMLYCMECVDSHDCFLSAWLVGKQYYILGKAYTPDEYRELKAKIIAYMQATGEYGKLFPAYFSPASYDESLAGLYYPLTRDEQESLWFRPSVAALQPTRAIGPSTDIPDQVTTENMTHLLQSLYWDNVAMRPIQFFARDVELCQSLGIPVNDTFYIRRIRENFENLNFTTELRDTLCAKTGKSIQTTLPNLLDWRIISEDAYLQLFS